MSDAASATERQTEAALGLFGAGLKAEAEALLQQVDAQAAKAPALLATRAQLARAEGDLATCEAILTQLCQAGEAEASQRFLQAILGGQIAEPLPSEAALWPVPFWQRPNFLAAEQIDALFAMFEARQGDFGSAAINRDEETLISDDVRSAKILFAPQDLQDWFLPLLTAAMTEALPVIQVAPFEVGKVDLQCTVSHGGDFYKEHRDCTPDDLTDIKDRRVSFVYYFNREPARFQGGDLKLYDSDRLGQQSDIMAYTRIRPRHNNLLLFPSPYLHEVMPVDCNSDVFLDGRLTVNGWFYQRPSAG